MATVDGLESSRRAIGREIPKLQGPRFTHYEINRFEALLRPLVVDPRPVSTTLDIGSNGIVKRDNNSSMSCVTKPPITLSRSASGRHSASLRSRDYILKDWNWNNGVCTCDLCRTPTSACASCRKNAVSSSHQPRLLKGCDCNLCQNRRVPRKPPLALSRPSFEPLPPVLSISGPPKDGSSLILQTLQTLGTETKAPTTSLPQTPVPITTRLPRMLDSIPQKELQGPTGSSSSSFSSSSSSFASSSLLSSKLAPPSSETPPTPSAPQAETFVAPASVSAPEPPQAKGKRRKAEEEEQDRPKAKAPSFSFGTPSEPAAFSFDFLANSSTPAPSTNPAPFSSFQPPAFDPSGFTTPAFDPANFGSSFSGSFSSAAFPTLSAPSNLESSRSGKAAKTRKYASRNNLEAGLKLYEDQEELEEEVEVVDDDD